MSGGTRRGVGGGHTCGGSRPLGRRHEGSGGRRRGGRLRGRFGARRRRRRQLPLQQRRVAQQSVCLRARPQPQQREDAAAALSHGTESAADVGARKKKAAAICACMRGLWGPETNSLHSLPGAACDLRPLAQEPPHTPPARPVRGWQVCGGLGGGREGGKRACALEGASRAMAAARRSGSSASEAWRNIGAPAGVPEEAAPPGRMSSAIASRSSSVRPSGMCTVPAPTVPAHNVPSKKIKLPSAETVQSLIVSVDV